MVWCERCWNTSQLHADVQQCSLAVRSQPIWKINTCHEKTQVLNGLKPVRETKILNIYRDFWWFLLSFVEAVPSFCCVHSLDLLAFPLVLHREGTWRRQDRPRPRGNLKPETYRFLHAGCFVNVYTKGMSEYIGILRLRIFVLSRFVRLLRENTTVPNCVAAKEFTSNTCFVEKKQTRPTRPNTLPFPPPFVASLLEKRCVPSMKNIQHPARSEFTNQEIECLGNHGAW